MLGGADLRAACAELELEERTVGVELIVVDADDDACVARSAAFPPDAPRVFVAERTRAELLRTAGAAHVVTRPVDARTLGPVVFALERARPMTLRLVLFCSASGATGRTLLVANLASRIASRMNVLALDATGTGALAWRLGASVAPWSDIAAVGPDLAETHLRLAAAERSHALVLGGAGAPDPELIVRVARLARDLGLVLVDAPAYRPSPALVEIADRVVVSANPDPASAAATAALLDLFADAQLVVSQAEERDVPELRRLFGRPPSFLLPRDERSCRAATRGRSPAGGRLGAAYDAIAELLLAESGA